MFWRERILRAQERGSFTAEDHELADGWNTCAVGECFTRFGLTVYGDLCDVRIPWENACSTSSPAGGLFPYYVRGNDFFNAERVLDAIEDHALRLKREG